MSDTLPKIGMFWTGRPFSYLEQLCAQSFLDAGHEVLLYTFGDVENVPDGVKLCDAAAVSNQLEEMFSKFQNQSGGRSHLATVFSDIFRYRLLAAVDNIIWADLDAYCVKPFRMTAGCFFGWETPEKTVQNGVLGLSRDSATLQNLLEFVKEEYPIPPWYRPRQRQALRRAKKAGNPVHVTQLKWGVLGPAALTHFLNISGQIEHTLPSEALYPYYRRIFFNVVRRPFDLKELQERDIFSVHFYGSVIREKLIAIGGPPKHGLLGQLLMRHGIDPLAAPLTR